MHGTVSITTARGQLITNLSLREDDDEITALGVAARKNPLGMSRKAGAALRRLWLPAGIDA